MAGARPLVRRQRCRADDLVDTLQRAGGLLQRMVGIDQGEGAPRDLVGEQRDATSRQDHRPVRETVSDQSCSRWRLW